MTLGSLLTKLFGGGRAKPPPVEKPIIPRDEETGRIAAALDRQVQSGMRLAQKRGDVPQDPEQFAADHRMMTGPQYVHMRQLGDEIGRRQNKQGRRGKNGKKRNEGAEGRGTRGTESLG